MLLMIPQHHSHCLANKSLNKNIVLFFPWSTLCFREGDASCYWPVVSTFASSRHTRIAHAMVDWASHITTHVARSARRQAHRWAGGDYITPDTVSGASISARTAPHRYVKHRLAAHEVYSGACVVHLESHLPRQSWWRTIVVYIVERPTIPTFSKTSYVEDSDASLSWKRGGGGASYVLGGDL